MTTLGADLTGPAYVGDVARHLVLPAITLGLFHVAVYTRLTRAAMIEAAGQDWVRTARAKGASESRVMRVHVLRSALLPVITFAGLHAGQLIGGAVLVETVFTWPGIGRLAFEALLGRDYNVLLGILLCTSCFVVIANMITDVLYLFADPRVDMGASWVGARIPRALLGAAGLGGVALLASPRRCCSRAGRGNMVADPMLPPLSPGLPLGSDILGRDVAAQVAYGAIVSLVVGITSTLTACSAGSRLAAWPGISAAAWTRRSCALTEFVQTVPSFVLALVLVALFRPSITMVIVAISVVSWPPVVRLVRGEFLSLREREFVQAAVVIGKGDADHLPPDPAQRLPP